MRVFSNCVTFIPLTLKYYFKVILHFIQALPALEPVSLLPTGFKLLPVMDTSTETSRGDCLNLHRDMNSATEKGMIPTHATIFLLDYLLNLKTCLSHISSFGLKESCYSNYLSPHSSSTNCAQTGTSAPTMNIFRAAIVDQNNKPSSVCNFYCKPIRISAHRN